MDDREKVISEFEDFVKSFSKRNDTYYKGLFVSVLTMLKEQDDMGKELTDAMELIHKKNARIIELKDLLKEQEAKTQGADSGMVKPHYNVRTNWYECGACRYSMTSGMHCHSELIPAYKVGFCAKCGKGVRWE